jgi:hypothetical protein
LSLVGPGGIVSLVNAVRMFPLLAILGFDDVVAE